MILYQHFYDSKKYYIKEKSFSQLMQQRIYRVLIICSNYDFYMLEEDGRIDEQIFNEYVSLNLSYPPIFIHARGYEEAFGILENDKIDLVISMLSVGGIDAFALAHRIKEKYRKIPIVVLTPFSREVSLKLQKEDLSAIEYVFCWLGDADLLLAIIKLIEDRMNIDTDIETVGVQTILLVEDSIRFYSTYLPNIYKIIMQQSQEFMLEGANDHECNLLKRGRSKILLATNFNHAVELYEKYKKNMLGVISDIRYKKDGVTDAQAGFKLCMHVRNDSPNMPFLLQSTEIKNQEKAKELGVEFIYKNSDTLTHDIQQFVKEHFAFGDFVFRMPDTKEEIGRAHNLADLQRKILTLPDESLAYHIGRDDFSRWLSARALFPIAEIFKEQKPENFNSLSDARSYIFDEITKFRINRGRGIISNFDPQHVDDFAVISRIGEGSLGGKARGLAFIDSLIKKHEFFYKFDDVIISIPRSAVLCTGIFDEFMNENNLFRIALSDATDKEIVRHFAKARLSDHVLHHIEAFVASIDNPIAVRSSSLLEDSHYQPFAGIYSTFMVPNIRDNRKLTVKMVATAIKSVYASVYFKSSKSYINATKNIIDEEKMAIVLQEVCGSRAGNLFYPTLSGVARSINFYPIDPEKPEDGIANIGFGLGRIIVDGGRTLRFSPKYPRKILQLSSPAMAMKDTQRDFFALNLDPKSFKASIWDDVNFVKLPIDEALNHSNLNFVASTYDFRDNIMRDGISEGGKKLITFSNILKNSVFPLAEIIEILLETGQKEINNPIEIEFAANLDTGFRKPKIFNYLQIRPIVENKDAVLVDLDKVNNADTILSSFQALGNGIIDNVYDMIYVKPDCFNPADTKMIAQKIEKINDEFVAEARNYFLIGPGRWGSSDPWLGIPVKWSQISQARLIAESGLDNYRIDPSQGTHFFQNLTSFRVGYFTLNPFLKDGFYDIDFLNKQPAVFEDKYIRHIRFEKPMIAKINARENRGVVLKPGIN